MVWYARHRIGERIETGAEMLQEEYPGPELNLTTLEPLSTTSLNWEEIPDFPEVIRPFQRERRRDPEVKQTL